MDVRLRAIDYADNVATTVGVLFYGLAIDVVQHREARIELAAGAWTEI